MNDSMAEYRRLIKLLKARRCELGLTQIDLCSRMGLTDNFVNRWENLRSFPKGPMLIHWAQELGFHLTAGLPRPNYVPFTDDERKEILRKWKRGPEAAARKLESR